MYYIISLKNTSVTDNFLTLWRPSNKGYCYAKEAAGKYDTVQDGYHNDSGNLPITIRDAKKVFRDYQISKDFEPAQCIPNEIKVLEKLGVKWVGKTLVRI